MLERSGWEVVKAPNGKEAAVLLEGEAFNAVFTDVDMPGLSGLELAADVRRLSPHTQVVLMSGNWFVGGTDIRTIARRLGMKSFLTKPFPLREVQAALEQGAGDEAPAIHPLVA